MRSRYRPHMHHINQQCDPVELLRPEMRTIWSMQIDAEIIERLDEQSELLLKMYQLELVRDPSSRATESSRSNMIALRHSIAQIYGEVASSGLLSQANPGRDTTS